MAQFTLKWRFVRIRLVLISWTFVIDQSIVRNHLAGFVVATRTDIFSSWGACDFWQVARIAYTYIFFFENDALFQQCLTEYWNTNFF
jgi:hypothetical protein